MFTNSIKNESNGLRKPHFPVEALKAVGQDVRRGSKNVLVGPDGVCRLATIRIPPGIRKTSNKKGTFVSFNWRSQREEIEALTGVLPKTSELYARILQGINIVLGIKKSTLSKFWLN